MQKSDFICDSLDSYISGLIWYESTTFSLDYRTSFPLQSSFKNRAICFSNISFPLQKLQNWVHLSNVINKHGGICWQETLEEHLKIQCQELWLMPFIDQGIWWQIQPSVKLPPVTILCDSLLQNFPSVFNTGAKG